MNKTFLIILLSLFSFTLNAQSSDDVKSTINAIKIDPAYLSAEATEINHEDALASARQTLLTEINNWISQNTDGKDVRLAVLQDLSAIAQQIDMKRGVRTRVFVYVKKKDVSLLNEKGLQIPTSESEPEPITTELSVPDMNSEPLKDSEPDTNTEPDILFIPSPDDDKAVSISTSPSPAVTPVATATESTLSNSESKNEEQTEGESNIPETAVTPAENSSDIISTPTPQPSNDAALTNILSARSIQELKPIFAKLKEDKRIDYMPFISGSLPSGSYLIFYTSQGEIKGVVGKDGNNYILLPDRSIVNITNFNGCGAYMFSLK